MNLTEKLKEEWPPERVIVTCGECDGELLNTKKSLPAMDGPSYYSSLIKSLYKKHHERTGHDDLEVEINKQPYIEREIEATITVNE